MRVVFRTDAAFHVGTGHVMRCLTLANALRAMGWQTLFICRDHEGHLADTVRQQGHECILLPHPSLPVIKQPDPSALPPHAGWLGEAWPTDLQQTRDALAGCKPDWLVVDHYALDARWESPLRDIVGRIFVIDDLADRPHDCELLLDQTLGREPEDYTKWVPAHCRILTGPHYALLRPEFARWRDYSLARRQGAPLCKLLLNLGGVDPSNMTGKVLGAMAAAGLPEGIELTVVMGLSAPHLQEVSAQAACMPVPTTVITNAGNMAELMANSDLAIGAAGATSWERCCLGLPTIMLVLADNQKQLAYSLAKNGAVVSVHDSSSISSSWLLEEMNITDERLISISYRSRNLVDGLGCDRVIRLLQDKEISLVSLEKVEDSDAEYIFELQKKPGVREYFRNTAVPSWEEHKAWFSAMLSKDTSMLMKIMVNHQSVGILRLDGFDSLLPEVSIIIDPVHSGKGIGLAALQSAKIMTRPKSLQAMIHKSNKASHRIFSKAGFEFISNENGFDKYIYRGSEENE